MPKRGLDQPSTSVQTFSSTTSSREDDNDVELQAALLQQYELAKQNLRKQFYKNTRKNRAKYIEQSRYSNSSSDPDIEVRKRRVPRRTAKASSRTTDKKNKLKKGVDKKGAQTEATVTYWLRSSNSREYQWNTGVESPNQGKARLHIKGKSLVKRSMKRTTTTSSSVAAEESQCSKRESSDCSY